MKRTVVAAVTVLLMILPTLMALGSTQTRYIKDSFNEPNYTGDDGDLPWASPWYEANDALSGGAGAGQVHVGPENCAGTKCAHFEGQGLALENAYLKRFADLSNHTYADICFEYKNLVESDGSLDVYFSANGGDIWSPSMYTFDLADVESWHAPIPIDDNYFTEDFVVKLVVNGGPTTELTIDDVEIKGTVEESTTSTTEATTTTTKPATTTSTKATTTSSSPAETTTSTQANTTSSQARSNTGGSVATTTTTQPTTTTTKDDSLVIPVAPTVPPNSGIRDSANGLLARYDTKSFSGAILETNGIDVLGAEVTADFSITAETFGSARLWIAILALLIGALVIAGMDGMRWKWLPLHRVPSA